MEAPEPKPDRLPPSTEPAVLSLFTRAGLKVEKAGGNEPWLIAEAYRFWPSTGFWRSIDGVVQGYTAARLIAEIQGVHGLKAIEAELFGPEKA